MTIKLFKKADSTIRKVSDSYSIANFLTAEDSSKMSIAVSVAINHSETTTISSDRAYFVLEGEIVFNNSIIGNVGDVVFIPANEQYEQYSFTGTFKAVIVNLPPFKKSNEKTF